MVLTSEYHSWYTALRNRGMTSLWRKHASIFILAPLPCLSLGDEIFELGVRMVHEVAISNLWVYVCVRWRRLHWSDATVAGSTHDTLSGRETRSSCRYGVST